MPDDLELSFQEVFAIYRFWVELSARHGDFTINPGELPTVTVRRGEQPGEVVVSVKRTPIKEKT